MSFLGEALHTLPAQQTQLSRAQGRPTDGGGALWSTGAMMVHWHRSRHRSLHRLEFHVGQAGLIVTLHHDVQLVAIAVAALLGVVGLTTLWVDGIVLHCGVSVRQGVRLSRVLDGWRLVVLDARLPPCTLRETRTAHTFGSKHR